MLNIQKMLFVKCFVLFIFCAIIMQRIPVTKQYLSLDDFFCFSSIKN